MCSIFTIFVLLIFLIMKRLLFTVLAIVAVVVSANAQGVNFIEGKPLADVLVQAKNEGKLVFVDCYTEWCGPCKMMATKEFVKKEAGDYFNAKFINFKIDMEKGEGPEVAKKYDVAAYPTFLILEANGDLRGRCVGSAAIDAFIKKVEEVLNQEKGLPWYQKKFKAGERDPQFLKDYVKILNDNYMRDELKNITAEILKGKSGAQIASDKDLFNTFMGGGFTPFDEVFLSVYKERATVGSQQGEKAVKQMDNIWLRHALRSLKFDGKEYQGFDDEQFEVYKKLMAENNVPDMEGIINETMRNKARYAKDYPAVYQGLLEDMKTAGEISDRLVLTDMDMLAKDYKSNKKAMKNITKLAKQRIAELQKKDTSGERQFEMEGKSYTMTTYLIRMYEDVIKEAAKK